MIRASLLLATCFALVSSPCHASVTEKTEQSFPAIPGVAVELANVNGSIDVTAWDKPEVSVVAEKQASTQKDLQQIVVKIDARPDQIRIKTDYPHHILRSSHASVRYWLRVPSAASLRKIDSVNCAISIAGVKGPITLSTVNGSVDIQDLASSLSLSTVNGSSSVAASAVPPGARIEIHSVNGGIKLALPAQASARFGISSVIGHVRSDFSLSSEGFIGRTYKGVAGDGSAEVRIDSVNGSVSIEKR